MAARARTVSPGTGLALLLLVAPALLWLVGLIVLPHVELAFLSLRARVAPRVFEWSLAQYRTFFEEPLYWRTFVRTATMSILATLATFAIAFPAAWYIAKIAKGRAKSLLFVLCLVPFWVSETVRTLGWMILLRESGVLPRLLVDVGLTAAPVELLYHDATILVGLVYTSLLFMVVPLVSALETLDDSLIEAAYDLGGSGASILQGHRDPTRCARDRSGRHRRVHADARQLPDADTIGRQEFALVHRADLRAVHHALQLGAGRRVRLPPARPLHRDRLARPQAHGPALRRRDAPLVIPSLPRGPLERVAVAGYVAAFFAFLFLPLVVVALFAFNDANYPAPPWRGFTLDWFVGASSRGRVGLFADHALLSSIWTSVVVALWVTMLAVAVGMVNAFLLERGRFRGKAALSLAMLAPLVIPGVILGISILAFASRLAQFADDVLDFELEFLRPGLPLVVAGQFSFIVSIATLTIAARLKRFDVALEEAALNLGATRAAVLWTVTLPYLRPALVGAAAIAFLMSFENFNTTLMLVGSDAPLTIMMYGRMREGASPVLNAVSLFLMVASALLALTLLRRPPRDRASG